MKHAKMVVSVLLLWTLQACANPPGSPQPKPTDYQELNHATEVFKRWSLTFGQDPDVTSVFLTTNNNPRRMVVHVKDHASHDRLLKQYGGTIEGIDVWYYIDYEPNAGDPLDPIMAVPKIEPPKTWWEKIMAVFVDWRSRIPGAGAQPAASPPAAPAVPPPVPAPVGSTRTI